MIEANSPGMENYQPKKHMEICITPVNQDFSSIEEFTRQENDLSKLEKPDEELRSFQSLAESLRARGANIQIIPADSPRASYSPNTDTIRVHENDFFDILEERIHRIQVKAIEGHGFKTLDAPLAFAAEVGAASELLEKSEEELEKVNKKMKEKESEITEEDVKKVVRLDEVISQEHYALMNYQAKLFSALKKLSKEKLREYEKIFNHPLFKNTKYVVKWVELGLASPKLMPVHNPDDFSTCFIDQ